MWVAAKIAQRELRGGLRGFRVFLACLTLGIAAIAAIGSIREGIQTGLENEGAALLGGDAEIQLTYRFADQGELAWMSNVSLEMSEIVDFRSMAFVDDGGMGQRALTQLKAIDGAYPLYGQVVLEPAVPLGSALAGKDGLPGAVMDRVLVERLGLTVGSKFRLGNQIFALGAILKREPDGANGFSMGPRTIVRKSDLSQSGLLAPGTLFESAYRLKLGPDTDLEALKQAAQGAMAGGGLRWRDRRDGAPGVAVFVDRLGTFLVLVGLAGLIVGGVGVSAAVRVFLTEKRSVIATLKSLGANRGVIFQIYLLQIALMAILGISLGLFLGALAPFILAPVLQETLPVPPVLGLFPVPLFQAFTYGALVVMLFSFWPLAQATGTRVASLFRGVDFGVSGRIPWWAIGLSAGLLALLVGVAAAFTGQFKLVIWSALGLILAFVALLGAGVAIRKLAAVLARLRLFRRSVPLHLALGSVAGPGQEGRSVILSLGLGLCVLAAIGQVDSNLRGAIISELPDRAPSFFVLDIQPDQLAAYMQRLDSDSTVSRVENAPMLRGVITDINGKPAAETAGDHWVISGDRGVTYAANPPRRSKVVKGTWWSADYSGAPQMSFAATEAEEMGLTLGDTVTVNILGRPITATITNFRDVDFSSAGMGFVMTLNPGALAGAPHSLISTIYAETGSEPTLLRDLTDAFPNITMITVRDAIERVGAILGAIAAAITYGALATLLTGLVVLIGTAAVGERARSYEAAVLKSLGATRRIILISFLLRSLLLGLAAGLVAVVVGAVSGWAVMSFVMEMDYSFAPGPAVLAVGTGILITEIAGFWFSLKSLRIRASSILRTRE